MGTRIRVSNLPSSETEEGLTARFRKFGGVRSVAVDSPVRFRDPMDDTTLERIIRRAGYVRRTSKRNLPTEVVAAFATTFPHQENP